MSARLRTLLGQVLRPQGTAAVAPANAATIDVAKATSAPSPFAPVDLSDAGQVAGVMHLAARIGDILLASGTSNKDTQAQIRSVVGAYGLHHAHVDITFNAIMVSCHFGPEQRPLNVFRVVGRLSIDFSKLSAVDRLLRRIQAGAVDPAGAVTELDAIVAAPTPYSSRVALAGWALFGGSVAILLGGGWVVTAISCLSAAVIILTSGWLDARRLPPFFQNVAGGFVATLPALLSFHFFASTGWDLGGVDFAPGQIIASGIVVMLAGLTLVQSIQDGITGAPVTASARFFDTLMMTGGIVAGVGLGIEFGNFFHIALPVYQAPPGLGLASATVKIFSGAAAAAAFAVACYSEWGSVLVSGISALMGSALYYMVLIPLNLGPVVALGIAATAIGLAGGLLARRYQIPPLITAIAGITPLLPGIHIYRGMYAMMHDQMVVSFSLLVIALATATSLAAGVYLGEWVARKLRRPPIFRPYRALARRLRSPFPPAPGPRS